MSATVLPRDRGTATARLAVGATLLISSAAMALGILAARVLWLPRIWTLSPSRRKELA